MFDQCAALFHALWVLCHALFVLFNHAFMFPAFLVFALGFFA
jgi:hypothetical protein